MKRDKGAPGRPMTGQWGTISALLAPLVGIGLVVLLVYPGLGRGPSMTTERAGQIVVQSLRQQVGGPVEVRRILELKGRFRITAAFQNLEFVLYVEKDNGRVFFESEAQSRRFLEKVKEWKSRSGQEDASKENSRN